MRKDNLAQALNYYKSLKPSTRKFRLDPTHEKVIMGYFSSRNYFDSTIKSEEVVLEEKDVNNMDELLKKNIILTYLNTFFNRSPNYFSTYSFKKETIEFNNKIKNDSIKSKKIEEIIKSGVVNLEDFKEGGILDGILPNDNHPPTLNILQQSVYTMDDPQIILGTQEDLVSRVYVNPNKDNYYDFLNYVLNECLKNEINIKSKTRIAHSYNNLDNLIFYIPSNKLGIFFNILHNYEKNNKDKVSCFNSPPGLLEKNEHTWYGYGLDPHRLEMKNGSQDFTLNDAVDFEYLYFLLPTILLNHFDEIINGHEKEILDYLVDKNGLNISLEDAKQLITNPNYRKNIVEEIYNFKNTVSYYEEQNGKKNEMNNRNYINGNCSIFNYKINELNKKIPFFYKIIHALGGKFTTSVTIKQKNIETGTYDYSFDVYLQKLFLEFLNIPKNFDKVLDEMEQYDELYLKNMPYISDNSPFISKIQENEIKRNKDIVFGLLHARQKDIYDENSDLLFVNEFINGVGGLDTVINAIDYCEGFGNVPKDYLDQARFYVENKLRPRRAIDIIKSGKSLSELSRFELEDIELENINYTVFDAKVRKTDSEEQQYTLCKGFIDMYGSQLSESDVIELEVIIKKYLQNSYYQRRLLNYMYDKVKENEITMKI